MTRGRVLIVEDEPDLAWVEQFNLETEGYEVRWAAEGGAAISALEDFKPEVIVLDLMLPHVDGWAVLEKAQEMPASLRPNVIVVSAVAGMEDKMNAEYLGVGHFLAKPFEMEDLINLVAHALRAA
jgi:DNA-binding response OmpR family regulator